MAALNCLYINITFYIPLELCAGEHLALMARACAGSGVRGGEGGAAPPWPARWLPLLA